MDLISVLLGEGVRGSFRTGQTDTGKGFVMSTDEMKQQSTFEGWDFDDVWLVGEVHIRL